MPPSARTASRATRGSDLRSIGCSSATPSGAAIAPSMRMAASCTNQRSSPTSDASRDTAGVPKPTIRSSARFDATVWCSTETTGFSDSVAAMPIVAIDAADRRPAALVHVADQHRRLPHRQRVAEAVERLAAGVAADGSGRSGGALVQRFRHHLRVVVRARHEEVFGERFHVLRDVTGAGRVLLEREEIDQERHRQRADVLLAEAVHPLRQLRRQVGDRHPLRARADAVERVAVRLRYERLVVVGDEQLLHRRPQHLKLARAPEIGFAQHVPRQREDARLAVVVGRDGVEDRREPVGRLAVERQRGRQQLRHLHIVERRGDAADDDRSPTAVRSLLRSRRRAAPASRRAGRGSRPPTRGCPSLRASGPATSP